VLVGLDGMPFVRTTQAGVAATLEELRADEDMAVADDERATEDELRAAAEDETPATVEEAPPLALEGVEMFTEEL
jgi:hypothetical protein